MAERGDSRASDRGGAPGIAQTREMTLGHVNPANYGTTLAADQFVAKVAELTATRSTLVWCASSPRPWAT